MLVVMPPTDSPPLEKIKRKYAMEEDFDLSSKAVDRPLRRRYETETPAVQMTKHAKELAELRHQSEVLKQTGDLAHDEKQRQFGIIYSRRKRLREKQKVLELEEECDRIRSSNQQLKVDNSRLEAILSVVTVQASQMEHQASAPVLNSQASSFMQAQSGQRFPTLPLPQVCQPFEPVGVSSPEHSYYQQPLTYLGHGASSFAPGLVQTRHISGPEATSSTIPSLMAAIASHAQAQSGWQQSSQQRMLSHQMVDQHFQTAPSQLSLSNFRSTNEMMMQQHVHNSAHSASDPNMLHSNMMASSAPSVWNQGSQAASMSSMMQHLPPGAMDHQYPTTFVQSNGEQQLHQLGDQGQQFNLFQHSQDLHAQSGDIHPGEHNGKDDGAYFHPHSSNQQ